MTRNMCFRIDSIGAECFCPFRAKVARHYRYPGRCPGLTALWPFRPLADSLLPRLMSGEIKVNEIENAI